MASELGAGAGLIKRPCLLRRSFLLMRKKLGERKKRDNLVGTTCCTKEGGVVY